jgi:hypothetical protein
MPLPAWPVTVPYKAATGWQMPTPFIPPVATEMNSGHQRLRSKPGSNVAVVDYPLVELTLTQWETLDTFFRTTLGNGASRFTMSVLTGKDYETKTVQFEGGQPPQYVQRQPNAIRVTMKLRIYGM